MSDSADRTATDTVRCPVCGWQGNAEVHIYVGLHEYAEFDCPECEQTRSPEITPQTTDL